MVAITHLPEPRPALRLVSDDEAWIPLARVRAGRPGEATFRARRAAVLAILALLVAAVVAMVTLVGREPVSPVSILPPGAEPAPAAAAPGRLQPSEPIAQSVYVVQPGDTVWTIARQLAAPGVDVREVVDRLVEANGGASLSVGQRLVLP